MSRDIRTGHWRRIFVLAWLGACLAWPYAQADTGKLLLTGGVGSIDGAAGGGLTPWAVIGNNATDGEIGASLHLTRAVTQDYRLTTTGATLGLWNRLELSLARQDFDTGNTGVALGLPGLRLKQDMLGLKWRLAGEAILDSDRLMPQIAIGLEHKRLDAGGLAPTSISARPSFSWPRASWSTARCARPGPTRMARWASAAAPMAATV